MKKRNNQTAKIVQRGGLMIEALAMLGLISVVTPTMYKKAAERTMEVEDINTASTIRTYMNAADAYIANNYGSLMDTYFSEVQEVQDPNYPDDETKKITIRVPKADGTTINLAANDAGFTKYLPYGFNPSTSLYDYNTPKIRIVKNGTNLTAFVLFPRKAVADVGQERTTRIASLIGSAGGYMPNDSTARGVGGIWQLQNIGTDNGIFKAADFTENVDAKQYSLVTTSSRSLGEANGGVMDNDKYLQRTYENGQEWRNTMHADLYMGNHMTGETQAIVQDKRARNSIRDVKSLIIGSETANETEGGADDTLYGLYIAGDGGSTYTSAYIGGSLRALEEQFAVDIDKDNEPSLNFGTDDKENYNLQIAKNGDIYDEGHSGVLFNQFSTESDNMIGIARDDEVPHVGDSNYLLQITRAGGVVDMHLINDNTFHIYQTDSGNLSHNFDISMNDNVFNIFTTSGAEKRISMFHDMDANYVADPDNASQALSSSSRTFGIDNNGDDSFGNTIDLTYSIDTPEFGVDIGSNVRVQGVMTAGQVDTQHLRSSTFETGSENIDDDMKWMKVDQYGVKLGIEPNDVGNYHYPLFMMHSSENSENSDTALTGNYKGVRIASDGVGYVPELDGSGGGAVLNLITSKNAVDNYMDGDDNNIGAYAELRAEDTHLSINGSNSEILLNVGGATNYNDPSDGHYGSGRVRQLGGHFDLDAANLNVTDKNSKPVFSVRGNSGLEDDDDFARFNNQYTSGANAEYNVAVHGNALFASQNITSSSTTDTTVKYLSIGKNYDKDAGVNIIAPETESDTVKNVLVIDQTEGVNSKNLPRDVQGKRFYLQGYGNSDISEVTDAITGLLNTKSNIDPGSVYIRKGMIEIVPDEDNSANKEYYAHQGSGVIRASRFVANNWDSNGRSYKFFTPLHPSKYVQYNGNNHLERYQTYMVNPAYTSVMKDIKLTTRGGARLSDILPDFINKGIYVANNSYDENITLDFDEGYKNYATGTQSDTYASPYLGSVPAPQCPPGYAKVITVHPISFNIAQAGSLEYINGRFRAQESNIGPADYAPAMSDTGASNTTGVTNVGPNLNKYTPQYNRLEVGSGDTNNNPEITLQNSEGTTSHTVTNMQNFGVVDGSGNVVYVLSADSAAASKPLMFQQSTYLKTKVVTLVEENGYTSGWAALMGFIYPYTYYGKVIDNLTDKENRYLASTTSTSWYWNIFPVLKNSLEATATVYCYFDRKNIYGDYNDDKIDFDSYDYINTPATSYEPQNSSYRERLNDPTLKYNELW